MNKLSLPGRVWIASDIHLGPDSPATAAAFMNFLERAASHADTLILAGDIFDAWIGDDLALHEPPTWLEEALQALRQAGERCSLWLGHGNRDFLMGDTLMRHLGAKALPETSLLLTDAGRILLAHGDEYCTADAGYQRFRRLVRNPAVQAAFLALPLRLRRGIAARARQRSMRVNQYKHRDIMDVELSAISDALRRADTTMLIHGHTHQPARHQMQVDGRDCERLVLPDWDFDATPPRGGWVEIDAHGVRLVQRDGRLSAAQASK